MKSNYKCINCDSTLSIEEVNLICYNHMNYCYPLCNICINIEGIDEKMDYLYIKDLTKAMKTNINDNKKISS